MVDARGLWFVAPGRVEIGDVELEPVRDDRVLVQTRFSGISSGTELLAYRGQLDPALPLDEAIRGLGGTFAYPFRYGYSCVGTVLDGGEGRLAEGALVFAFQPHQDVFVSRTCDLVALGEVDPRIATLYPLLETALQITLDAGPVLDDPVVVFGLGAVGLLACVLLRRAGARVVAVEPKAWRRRAANGLGIDAVAPDEVTAALAERGYGDGVPLAIEATGDPSVLGDALHLLAHEGTALVASWYGTKVAHLDLGAEFHRRRLTLRSTQVTTIPARLSDRWTLPRRSAVVAELLASLPLGAVATHVYGFDDAPEAFAALDRGEEGVIHVALGYG